MTITLEAHEVQYGASVGLGRRIASMKKTKALKGKDLSLWEADIEGALAEMAVAKATGSYWNAGVNTFKRAADVSAFEVRQTSLPTGRLIIRPKDDPNALYILVIGSCPTYQLLGFIKGADAMDKKYMKNPGGVGHAFFVPQEDLTPIEEL